MAEVSIDRNSYVKFYIKTPIHGVVEMINPPGGWRDDDLELNRSQQHGIFNEFTNELEFYKKYRDIIENTFQELGNNVSVYLIKKQLEDTVNGVMFIEKYRGRADWETKVIKNGVLKIKFNSNDLEELIEANETDEIEIETTTSIDGEDIGEMETFLTSLSGRNIAFRGESILDQDNQPNYNQFSNKVWFTPRTKLIAKGEERHVSVDSNYANIIDPSDYGLNNGESSAVGFAIYDKGNVASNAFFVDTVEEQSLAFLKVDYHIKCRCYAPSTNRTFQISIAYKAKNYGDGYTTIHRDVLFQQTVQYGEPLNVDIQGSVNYDTPHNVAVVLVYRWFSTSFNENVPNFYSWRTTVSYQRLKVTGYTYYEPSLDLSFVFVHDVFERLLQILTNKKGLFYSKYFGRTELGYENDGEAGLIGLMSGYWARAFSHESEKYKPPKFDWKKLLESCNAVFNVGMGTEIHNNIKKARIEKIKYFYQQQVVVKLGQVSNLERKYDKTLYHSGIEIGYNKGGDYENEIGLDEPNTLTKFTTPDRKSKNKYRKISDIRSDEYGLEKIRRKPELLYPDEDTRGDEHNWFLDLKRAFNGKFQQTDWNDRLESEPIGINDPATYRAYFFTPLRMLFRHGWILRAGLSTYLNKKIKYISSKANTNLQTHFISESQPYQENLPEGLLVNKLERSRFLPVEINFEHSVDDNLINLIYGKTTVMYEGSLEDIPNYYFKFSWINEKQETETGYLMNFKPSKLGKFKMLKANEKLI